MTTKILITRKKKDKLDFIEIKNLGESKDTIMKVKREWEKNIWKTYPRILHQHNKKREVIQF